MKCKNSSSLFLSNLAGRFALVKEHLVEFNQLAMANAEGSEDMLNRVMTKDNIGLAALLETREGCYDGSGQLANDTLLKPKRHSLRCPW